MLKLLFGVLKLAAFAALVLVLGNWIRWDGKSVSDHVRSGLSQAERSSGVRQARDWAGELVEDAKEGASRITTTKRKKPEPSRGTASRADSGSGSETDSKEISDSERQKLRALIRELNSSR